MLASLSPLRWKRTMILPDIYWPLQINVIRKNSINNTFGKVRNGGTRYHQGWDLLAYAGTPCYAIADGVVEYAKPFGDFGKTVIVKFQYRGRTLYATYAHLSSCNGLQPGDSVAANQIVGYTGNTGNAQSMAGDDQHLHFEIRTTPFPGKGLDGRIDPKDFFMCVPLLAPIYDTRPAAQPAEAAGLSPLAMSAPGLKVAGVNMR